VPFFELPSLGGETTLRAFGQGRFVDNNAVVASFEERIRVWRRQIADYNVDVEIAPFLDIGRVMNQLSFRDLAHPEINEGIGVRIVTQPYVVGRLDLGHGKDGLNAFVGLDYPF
jgi:hemolysin activation/secretion protein